MVEKDKDRNKEENSRGDKEGMAHGKRNTIRIDRYVKFAAVCGKGGLEVWSLEEENNSSQKSISKLGKKDNLAGNFITFITLRRS